MDFNDFLEYCGGSLKLALHLDLKEQTVESWRRRRGVPSKYWSMIIELAGPQVTPLKLYLMNLEIREEAKKAGGRDEQDDKGRGA